MIIVSNCFSSMVSGIWFDRGGCRWGSLYGCVRCRLGRYSSNNSRHWMGNIWQLYWYQNGTNQVCIIITVLCSQLTTESVHFKSFQSIPFTRKQRWHSGIKFYSWRYVFAFNNFTKSKRDYFFTRTWSVLGNKKQLWSMSDIISALQCISSTILC